MRSGLDQPLLTVVSGDDYNERKFATEARVRLPEKYEREIDEILRKASFSTPRGGPRPDDLLASIASDWRRLIADLSAKRFLVIGLVLALFGYVLREFLPEIGAAVSLLALAFLLAGLALSMSRRTGKSSTGWRGRPLEEGRSTVDLWAVIVRRWREWRRGQGPNNPRRS